MEQRATTDESFKNICILSIWLKFFELNESTVVSRMPFLKVLFLFVTDLLMSIWLIKIQTFLIKIFDFF